MVKRKRRAGYRRTRRPVRRYGRRFNRRGRRMGRISYAKRRGILEPDATFVKIRYVQDLSTVAMATGASSYLDSFTANAVYHPDDVLGSTNNANGLSYYKQTYGRYCVLGSKARITACNGSSTAPRMFYLFPATDSLGQGTAIQIIQSQPYVKRTLLGLSTGGGNTKTLSSYMSTRKLLGKPGTTISPDTYAATGSQPTNQWFWYIFFHQNAPDTTSDITFNLEITYYVKFFDRTTLSAYQ